MRPARHHGTCHAAARAPSAPRAAARYTALLMHVDILSCSAGPWHQTDRCDSMMDAIVRWPLYTAFKPAMSGTAVRCQNLVQTILHNHVRQRWHQAGEHGGIAALTAVVLILPCRAAVSAIAQGTVSNWCGCACCAAPADCGDSCKPWRWRLCSCREAVAGSGARHPGPACTCLAAQPGVRQWPCRRQSAAGRHCLHVCGSRGQHR